MKKIMVNQDAKEPVPVEILATSICNISAGIKALRKGPLGERALLLLISEGCRKKNSRFQWVKAKVSVASVKLVLDSIENLQTTYLK